MKILFRMGNIFIGLFAIFAATFAYSATSAPTSANPVNLGETLDESQQGCTDSSRPCVLHAASQYLKSILVHDASLVPLAETAQRWENGVNTANGAEAIRNSIKNDYALKAVQNIRDIRWVVDGNQVMALYLLDVGIPYTHYHVGTARIAERFLIEEGQIQEIEVIFCNSPGIKPEGRVAKSHGPLSYVCTRSPI